MKTRTIEYGPQGGVKIVEADIADPAPGEVQIRASACGVCAWDLFTFRKGGRCLPGHEGIGVISKVGPGVTTLRQGQRVVGHCLGFADYSNLPASKVYVLPEDSTLPDEQWIVEPVACVVTGIDHCHLKPADRVAVVGCGFMGLLLIQALGHTLCDQVIAIDIDSRRLEQARQFGATDAFNSADADVAGKIQMLKERQIDTVIDSSGSQAGLDTAGSIVRKGGRINLFGWNHGPVTFSGDAWHGGGYTIVNSTPPSALRDPWPAAIRLIHRGLISLKPLVTHTAKLSDYPNLLDKAGVKQEGYLKGVVLNR